MRCLKCGGKTKPIGGRVTVNVGDASFSVVTDVGHCSVCNLQVAQFNYKIEPICQPIVEDPLQAGGKEYNA